MNNDIIPFNYKHHEVRTVMIEGEPWFVAKDVCDILEIKNCRDAVSSLDDDEKNSVVFTDGKRGNPRKLIVNEPGLYTLIFKSNKPEAKAFKRWITHEVIPSLRKYGSYSLPQTREQQIAQSLLLAHEVIAEKDEEIAQLSHQCSELERTKAHISDKKTASAMGTASGAVRRAKKAEREAEKLRKKDEIRRGFVKFYSKITSVCPHCQYKIYPCSFFEEHFANDSADFKGVPIVVPSFREE